MLPSVVRKYQNKQSTKAKKEIVKVKELRLNKAHIADRNEEIFRLRRAGHSNVMIARNLGIGEGTVVAVVAAEIKRINIECRESAEDIQSMELARLDEMMASVYDAACAGDSEAINTVLKLMDQRAKYKGLYSASKLNVSGIEVKQYVGVNIDRV